MWVLTGQLRVVIRHGRRDGFRARSPRVSTRGFSERARTAQKAPGGSRGTPGRMPSRVPCCAGLNRDIACGHPAWTAGWFSHPVSPGFHPGLLVTRACQAERTIGEPATAKAASRGNADGLPGSDAGSLIRRFRLPGSGAGVAAAATALLVARLNTCFIRSRCMHAAARGRETYGEIDRSVGRGKRDGRGTPI